MAQRRMFSKTITNSSQFLMMPQSSQNLYFHLGMNSDDDGFCEHFTVMRMTDSKPDDLKILQAKGFVHVFDDKVLIIRDWHENNYIRSDRYSASKYLDIYKNELHALSKKKTPIEIECQPDGIPEVDDCETQVRLGKVRLGKVTRKESVKSAFRPPSLEEIKSHMSENNINSFTAEQFFYFYESKGWMIGKNKMKKWKAAIQTFKHRAEKERTKDRRMFSERNPYIDSLPAAERQRLIDETKKGILK